MKHLQYTILVLLGLTVTTTILQAQRTRADENTISFPAIRLNAGFGGGSIGFGATGGLSLQSNDYRMWTLRGEYIEEFRICIFGGCGEAEYRGSIGLLYGMFSGSTLAYASISGGLAATFIGRDLDDTTFQHRATVGFPIEGQAFLTPIPVLGIGLIATANFNPISSYYGIFFVFQLNNQW
jgi:hypothetical protein